jgi:hypothetical protein
VRYFDSALARDTGSLFQPALPLTFGGFIYALAGAAVGILAVMGGAKRESP